MMALSPSLETSCQFLATTTGYSSHSICCSFGCTCVAVQDVAVVTWTSRQHQNSSLQHVWCCFSAALRRRSLPPTLGKCSFVRRHQRLSLSRDLARPLQARLWQLRICWASCLSSTTSVVRTQHRSSFVFRLHRYDHVSDALAILHWLRLPEWVNFKLVLMAYRVLNGMAPPFLNQHVLVSSLPGHRHLRRRSSCSCTSHCTVCQQPAVARVLSQQGVPRRQPHRRSGLATVPSVGAVP